MNGKMIRSLAIASAAALGMGGASMARGALLADYTFNDQNATTATDSAGSSSGAISGTPTYVASTGAGNYALHLDGTTSITYPSTNFATAINASDAFTMELWVRDLGTTVQGANERYVFGQLNKTVAISATEYAQGTYSDGYVGGSNSIETPTVLPTGTAFHYLAYTYDSSTGDMNLYVDGVLSKTKTLATPPTDFVTANDFYTDAFLYGDTTARLTGDIDEIRLYDSALSSTQIAANNLAGPSVPEPATLAVLGLGAAMLVRRRRSA
jgi:hypothetical protein